MSDLPGDPERLRNALRRQLGAEPNDCSSEPAPDAYLFALRCCWERMELLVGPAGARAILDHSIRSVVQQHPWIGELAVGAGIPGPPRLGAASSLVDRTELCAGLESLCVKVFQTVVELTGSVVAGPVLEQLGRWQGGT